MNKKSSFGFLVFTWLFFVLLLSFCFYHFLFFERIYPNTYVSGVNIGGLTQDEATKILSQITFPDQFVFLIKGNRFEINLVDIEVVYDFNKTASVAYQFYRKNTLQQILLPYQQLVNKNNIPLVATFNQDDFNSFLKQKEKEELELAVEPKVSIINGEVFIDKGKSGQTVDYSKAKDILIESLEYGNTDEIVIPTVTIDNSLNREQTDTLYKRANTLLQKKIIFTFENNEYTYQKESLINLIDPYGGFKKEEIDSLITDVSRKIEREAQNPVFVFENDRVMEFSPAVNGVGVVKDGLNETIITSLNKLEKNEDTFITIEIPTQQSPPEYQTSQVNNLGINALIGVGKSKFSHSIPSRIHNVALAASKFNGILVKPGESFSFNKTLGDVSSYTGYQQAYIIKDGQTILGDGGGVCQVSTTLFRALLNSGLPITERRAHAYRVSYYEEDSPPGLDATVYDPSPDLKFFNDTPGHLLIQTKTDTSAKTLKFEIYGTDDGRVASISKPTVTNVTPPPEDLYIDDPSLPAGKIKQIDWKAWGAKVSFKYTVIRNDEVLIEKTFYSNYQPWQAKYLKGTEPTQ